MQSTGRTCGRTNHRRAQTTAPALSAFARPRALAGLPPPRVLHRVRQFVDDIGEVFLPQVQVLFVTAPLPEPFAENRPAHLLRARRLHGPCGFVEAHAGLLERQAAVIEYAAHLALEIRDR